MRSILFIFIWVIIILSVLWRTACYLTAAYFSFLIFNSFHSDLSVFHCCFHLLNNILSAEKFSDAHFLIMFQLTEFWFLLQFTLIDAAVDVFSYTICYISWNMHSWSDSSCQISCVWVRTVSVSHSDINQAEKWTFLSLILKLKLYNKYQNYLQTFILNTCHSNCRIFEKFFFILLFF